METVLWFKMFLFLIVIGTFMSLINTGGNTKSHTSRGSRDRMGTTEMVGTVFALGVTVISFFTGIGVLLGVGGAVRRYYQCRLIGCCWLLYHLCGYS